MTDPRQTMRLYTGPLSMFGAKAWIAALEKRLDCEVLMVPFNVRTGYDPKAAEVLRVNPKAQVPVLIHGDLEIFDSTQIFEYFEDMQPLPPLWPTDIRARARARNLELRSDEVFFPHVIKLMGLQDALDEPMAVIACDAINRYYETMGRVLGEQSFLCGSFSYADIAFYMAQLFAGRMGAPMTVATPHLLQWRERMSSRASVRTVVTPLVHFLRINARPVQEFLQGFTGAFGLQIKGGDMPTKRTTPKTIDEYISAFSPDVQAILQQVRQVVQSAAPDAQETISYQIPAFKLNGVLVYFAACKKHLGFYPPVKGDARLEKAVSRYAGEKGGLKFPFDQPIPFDLIKRITKLRVAQSMTKAPSKATRERS